ncbi:MAG: polysaccharide pyruvyl transferase CsaB [Candidatus Eremiobacteraeota bacterium]|nr:polysaccharide pyruvyl transferase CsaB [Candidatus Eremiobacteraeota bacterium]
MRFLLSGYYGFANLGDEALLAQIVSGLRVRWPLAEIVVLSAEPEETAHRLRVRAVPRMDFGAVRRAIDDSDVVLSGGGGLLQSGTSLKSLLYYAGIIRSAVNAKKRTMIFAQSIGPLDFWGRQTVRECCKGVTAATVRDERSRELLASLLPAVPVELTADPVFLYEPPEAPPDLTRFGLGPQSEPFVLFAVRKTSRFVDAVAVLARAADRLAEVHGARVAFVPFGGAGDAEAASRVIRRCRSQPALVELDDLDAVAAAIARARLVVGVRLHALILAVRLGTPFLAVSYDPKVSALSADADYPLAPLWSVEGRAPERDVEARVDEAWARREELAAHLRAVYPRFRAAADANFAALARIV